MKVIHTLTDAALGLAVNIYTEPSGIRLVFSDTDAAETITVRTYPSAKFTAEAAELAALAYAEELLGSRPDGSISVRFA